MNVNIERIIEHISEKTGVESRLLKPYIAQNMRQLEVGYPNVTGKRMATQELLIDDVGELRGLLKEFETSYPHHLDAMFYTELLHLYKICIGSAFNYIMYGDE